MNSTSYLYDCNPNDFAYMPYVEALEYKITQADGLLSRLLVPNHQDRDHVRLTKVQNAIKFNEKLLKEVKEQS